MRIRWLGPQVVQRTVGRYEWSAATGFVQEVTEAALVVELLTEPGSAFGLDRDDAVCALPGVGPQRAANLALAGIATLADLAALDAAGIKQVDVKVWASAQQVAAWVAEARRILGQSEQSEQVEEQEV